MTATGPGEDLLALPGLRWNANGSATLSGPLLEYSERLDACFVELARRWEPLQIRFPAMLPAADLDRIDYFRSFPHLATFPVCLDPDENNLESFRAGEPVRADGHLRLTRLVPAGDVLTPAACYPVYSFCAGQRLVQPRYVTISSTCFRRETHYVPLERQWSFTMREIVCLGTAEEVQAFRNAVVTDVEALVRSLGLSLTWEHATDPFFRPLRNSRYVMQQIEPTKHELVFDGRLAIGSANLHHEAFGRAYDIERSEGEPAHSACVAFGLERWLAALAHSFGTEPSRWPPPGAAPGRPDVAR